MFGILWDVLKPQDPSKKFRDVVRINLVQFSASELHKVSSYDHLKVNKVKIGILKRQHLYKITLPHVKSCYPL